MKTNYTQVSVTFEECGETLVSRGNYSSAKVQVLNSFQKNEVFKVLEQSKTLREPEFKSATKTTTLGSAFVEMALEKPRPPKGKAHWWLKTDEGKMAQKWGSYSDKEKVKMRLDSMANDQGLTVLTFDLL